MQSELRPAEPTRCADLVDAVAAGDDGVLDGAARAHIAQCLRCQAEVAAHRRLRRSLRELADASVPLDAGLERDILLALDRHDGRSRRVPGYAAATLGGLAAAAGVIALATRQRRGARLAG